MKMTLAEALSCPKGMNFEEYQKKLEADKKIAKRLRRLSFERDSLEDALDILSDEQGSERYQTKARRLEKVMEEIERLMREEEIT